MSNEPLNAAVKTRVPTKLKRRLKDIAAARHLDVADIVREALREFVAKDEELKEPEPEKVAA